MEKKYNLRSPAVKRLIREAQELSEPTEHYYAHPIDDNLFEWHFTVRGPADTEFSGGIYHGRILFPAEYPMKPPSVLFYTPSGRFETNKKICLSISGHHPETWLPSWSVRTALLAIIGFMPSRGHGAIGSLDYTAEERRKIARKSLSFRCDICGDVSTSLKAYTGTAESEMKEAVELGAQLSMSGEGDTAKNGSKASSESQNATTSQPNGTAAQPNAQPAAPIISNLPMPDPSTMMSFGWPNMSQGLPMSSFSTPIPFPLPPLAAFNPSMAGDGSMLPTAPISSDAFVQFFTNYSNMVNMQMQEMYRQMWSSMQQARVPTGGSAFPTVAAPARTTTTTTTAPGASNISESAVESASASPSSSNPTTITKSDSPPTQQTDDNSIETPEERPTTENGSQKDSTAPTTSASETDSFVAIGRRDFEQRAAELRRRALLRFTTNNLTDSTETTTAGQDVDNSQSTPATQTSSGRDQPSTSQPRRRLAQPAAAADQNQRNDGLNNASWYLLIVVGLMLAFLLLRRSSAGLYDDDDL